MTDSTARSARYSNWKEDLQSVYEAFVARPMECAKSIPAPVKIAILDTGLDYEHPEIWACRDNIKDSHNWLPEGPENVAQDLTGHGTFVTGLLLDCAPDADIYIAKVANKKLATPRIIAEVCIQAITS